MNDGKDPPPVTWDEAYAAEVDSEGGSALPTPTLEGSGDLKRVQSATPEGLEQRLLEAEQRRLHPVDAALSTRLYESSAAIASAAC